jgi:hypothetical protein
MICCKSYQDIPEDSRYAGPDTEDYFDMFLTAWCKENSIKDVNDEDYEVIRRYWYEFENGNGEEPDHNSDKTLEEMFAELKEYDENREKHTCETCERRINENICGYCRTGNNDDYTKSDYWKNYTRIEQRLWQNIYDLRDEKYKLKKQIAELEKENAELKAGRDINVFTKQLTNAKKLIKDLLGSENTSCEEDMYFEIRQKAENFLKENEVEK